MDILIALWSTVIAFCYCSQDVNITFHANRTTWNEAVNYCADRGGLLYSDEVDIRNRTDDEVWSGKYKAFTAWVIEWGCFKIKLRGSSNEFFSVKHTEQSECQQKCTGTDFFAVKGDICKCIHSAELNQQIKDISCTCTSCFKVLRHNIEKVDTGSLFGCTSGNTDCTCMAAECISKKLSLTPELCNQHYKIMCDNNDFTSNANQEVASKFCFKQNSFLRKYTEDQNICQIGSGQHWTSGRRSIYQFIVQHTDKDSTKNPLECFRVTNLNDQGSDYVVCDKKLPYFCKIGGNFHEDDTLLHDGNQGNNVAGAIGGTISAILIIAIFSGTGIYFFKRRKKPKQPKIRQDRVNSYNKENNSDGQYNDIDTATGGYSFAKPLSNNQEPTYNAEGDTGEYTRIVSSAFQIQNEASTTNNTISNPGYNDLNLEKRSSLENNVNNKRTNRKVERMADYDLAKPISDTDELDLYTANTDYDHLNSVKKLEMSDMKVYDHLNNATDSDPTYDHSGVVVREDTENYEHFNVEM